MHPGAVKSNVMHTVYAQSSSHSFWLFVTGVTIQLRQGSCNVQPSIGSFPGVVVVVVVVVVTSEEEVLVETVVVVVDAHAGKSTIQTHSLPTSLPVHDSIVDGRGSQEAVAVKPPPPMTIGPAELPHVFPSFSRNLRLSPARPSWHCVKPFLIFCVSVASPKPGNVLAQPSGCTQVWLTVSVALLSQPGALRSNVKHTV